MFDIKDVVADAEKEVAEEAAKAAKAKVKASLLAIRNAERVLANLRREHEVLLRDIGTE